MPLEDSHLAAKMQVYPLDFPASHPRGNSRSPFFLHATGHTGRLRLFPANLRPDGALPYGWIGVLEVSKLRPYFRLKSFRVLPARRSAMPLSRSFTAKVEWNGVSS
jgi:hypothetical protein